MTDTSPTNGRDTRTGPGFGDARDGAAGSVPAAQTRNRATARMLSWAGYAPFAILTLGTILPVGDFITRGNNLFLLIAYGAVILSFLGGIRWGVALAREQPMAGREYLTSVIPALIGWMAVSMPPAPALVLLAVTFAWHHGWDRRAAADGRVPQWYREMRLRVTAAVVVTLLIAAIAAFVIV